MSKNLCIDCEQPCFVNRIAVEIFDEDCNVIGDGYRCEECEKEIDEFIEERANES